MKKKIKDLTFFDLNKICFEAQKCDKCSLYIPDDTYRYKHRCLIGVLNSSLPEEWIEILEQEVET